MSSPSNFAKPTINFDKLDASPTKPYTQKEILKAMKVLHKMVHAQADAYGGKNSKLLPAGITEQKMTFKDFLMEDRSEFLAKQFGTKLVQRAKEDNSYKGAHDPQTIVNGLKAADPSGKNISFVIRMYVAGQFKFEDLNRLKSELAKFTKFKSKIENKDLNSYHNLDELYDVLDEFQADEELVSGKEQKKVIKSSAEKLIDTPHFKVIVPKTEEAACFYGSGTKWCTAAREDNAFNTYHEKGPLHIIIADINGKQRKFQLHYEEDQFMNERDQPVSAADISALSKIPEYAEFLNMLIKKHYEPHILAGKAAEAEKAAVPAKKTARKTTTKK